MAKFLGYIPGFRSNITWKKVVACIYYLFCVLMLAGGLPMFLFFLFSFPILRLYLPFISPLYSCTLAKILSQYSLGV